MNNRKAYTASKIFTGKEILHLHAVIVNNENIEAVIPFENIDKTCEIIDFKDALIAPAFIDLQLYGAHKRLLATYPDAETVKAIYEYSKAGGASHCMPTVATNTYDTIFKCIDAVRKYWNSGCEGVLGLHVEGPWISKEKRGAHNDEWIFVPTIEKVKELLDYGEDVIKIITLAPEICSVEIVELIHSYNIVVSAGHTNASYQTATDAFNKGIRTATHLYNAMSPLQHREPGMVGAVLDHSSVFCSIVPDGYHVNFPAIRIAKKIMGERLFAITDAVTETHDGFYKHTLEGDRYTANGILSGSALTMNKCAKNFIEYCDLDTAEALRMCSLYPARVIKKDSQLGLIEKEKKANVVVLSSDFNVLKTLTAY
jgi:N-acetylglucosamine-6-phosphate deacetylase